ncbi:MAG TPA: tetratricopeptide repeat protein [Casimicrobiaceae bacterium]|nr:tetratricopeptide repeat protein [Casimicrobiaceae bacterium]
MDAISALRRASGRALLGAVLFAVVQAASALDSSMVSPPAPYRAPYLPTSDAEVLQQVPPASDAKVREMKTLRTALDKAPADLRTADLLARAYIGFGREVGDAHYAGYAEAVIAAWMTRQPPPVEAQVLQAVILQFRHQFADARALLEKALARDPRNAQAWLTLATLDMVQGRYPAARDDCAQVTRHGSYVLGIACVGNLRSYLGEARQSVVILTQIAGDAPRLSASFKAWVEGLLAEANERLGDWPQAEAHYRKSLEYTPHDNFLLVAYADFLLDRGRPQEVLTLLADYRQSDTAFLRIVLAQAALHSADLPRYVFLMAARFEALRARGSDYYGREQVRFALHLQHDPQSALELAQRNWEVQRAPWDLRIFLEAADAARKPQAASDVLAFLSQTKLQDPIIEPLAKRLRAELVTR